MNTFLKEYQPSKSLSPFVEGYWEGSFNANATGNISMQMVPNGCLELIIHLNDLHCDLLNDHTWSQTPDYIIVGMQTQPYEVQFQNHVKVFAIRLKPEGIYTIFGIPASEVIGRYEDMVLLLGNDFRNFSHRLRDESSIPDMIISAENYLLKSLKKNNIDMSYVHMAAELIRNSKGIKIKELANQVFISQRQLERKFKNAIGISPKHYLRITRINEVMRYLNEHQEFDLVNVAYHCGYFDQAHFIHDFKRITGIKPSVYIRESKTFISNQIVNGFVV